MLLIRPIKTRFRYGYTWRLNLATQRKSLTHYAKGTQSNLKSVGRIQQNLNSSSTACKQTVSGTISLPSPGYFSPFPHGTSSLSVAGVYLALEDGPPGFPQGSTCPAVLGNLNQQVQYISFTGLSPSMVLLSSKFIYTLNFWLVEGTVIPSIKAPQPRIYNAYRLDIHSV